MYKCKYVAEPTLNVKVNNYLWIYKLFAHAQCTTEGDHTFSVKLKLPHNSLKRRLWIVLVVSMCCPSILATSLRLSFQFLNSFWHISGTRSYHSFLTTFRRPGKYYVLLFQGLVSGIRIWKNSIGLVSGDSMGISELVIEVIPVLLLKSWAQWWVNLAMCEDAASWWMKTLCTSLGYFFGILTSKNFHKMLPT